MMKKICTLICILAGIGQISAQNNLREVHIYCYYTQVLSVGHNFPLQNDLPVSGAEIVLLRDSLSLQVFRTNQQGYLVLEIQDNDQFYIRNKHGSRSMVYSGTMISDSLVVLIYIRSAIWDENPYILAWLKKRTAAGTGQNYFHCSVSQCHSGKAETKHRLAPKASIVLPQQVISPRNFLHYLSTTQF